MIMFARTEATCTVARNVHVLCSLRGLWDENSLGLFLLLKGIRYLDT